MKTNKRMKRIGYGWILGSVLAMTASLAQAQTDGAGTQVRSDGFALEYQGLQSHYSDIPVAGDWLAENKFNERGLALRWEFDNQWFVEGRASRGSHLRYLLETGEDEDGNPELDEAEGRTHAYSVGLGKRIWVNPYFSVLPSVSYFYREIRTPELFSEFDQQRFAAFRTREHSAGAGIKAEYRVISRFAISLNFTMLSSGERQQGIGVAYYFY